MSIMHIWCLSCVQLYNYRVRQTQLGNGSSIRILMYLAIERSLCFGMIQGNASIVSTWWRHQMETFSALLALCVGNSPVTGEFPSQMPVTRSFDVLFICAWINGSVSNLEAGDLRRHHAHYDVVVMINLFIAKLAYTCTYVYARVSNKRKGILNWHLIIAMLYVVSAVSLVILL